MKIIFNGSLLGREALCYQGREMFKQLAKNHTMKLGTTQFGGYWEPYFDTFQDQENAYILNGHVPHLKKLAQERHKNLISICVFETELPEDWIEALNIPEVKQVWTVSEFCKGLIEDHVNKPVKVVYLGVDERFSPKPINLFPKDSSFKFLSVSAPYGIGIKDRKGLDVLLQAFKAAFGDSPEVTLILKINTIYADRYARNAGKTFDLPAYIKSLLPSGNPGNIVIFENYLQTEGLNALYNSVDCGVFPSRAEGFGLPQIEMMKVGKTVITTDYSAPNEFSDPRLRIENEGLYPLDVSDFPYYDSLFAEPNVESLKKLMLQVFENKEQEKALAIAHSKTLQEFTWDKVGERMEAALKELSSKLQEEVSGKPENSEPTP